MSLHRQFNIRPRQAGKTTMLIDDYLFEIKNRDDLTTVYAILVVNNEQMKSHVKNQIRRSRDHVLDEEELHYALENIMSTNQFLKKIKDPLVELGSKLNRFTRGCDESENSDANKYHKIFIDEYLFFSDINKEKIDKYFRTHPSVSYRVETTSDKIYDKFIIMLARFLREHPHTHAIKDWKNIFSPEVIYELSNCMHTLLTDPSNHITTTFHDHQVMLNAETFYMNQGGIWGVE